MLHLALSGAVFGEGSLLLGRVVTLCPELFWVDSKGVCLLVFDRIDDLDACRQSAFAVHALDAAASADVLCVDTMPASWAPGSLCGLVPHAPYCDRFVGGGPKLGGSFFLVSASAAVALHCFLLTQRKVPFWRVP